ncbi:fasciclin domain-containing protein [Nocardia sp. NPDC052001]|uniref:fasciclin domain-containing protein n=1 Tax=Nocardia sp. NPDC052001 TaxID=3154853 RepID=UPI00341EFF76
MRYPAVAALALAVAASGPFGSPPEQAAGEIPVPPLAAGAGAAHSEPPELIGPGCDEYRSAAKASGDPAAFTPHTALLDALLYPPATPTARSARAGRAPRRITMFIPTATALSELAPEAAATFRTDPAAVLKLIAYQTIPLELTPEALPGTHPTLEGHSLTITRSGPVIRIGAAGLVCGGFHTPTATVYLIDRVLTPS